MDPRSFAATTAVPAYDKRFALLIDADNVSAKYLKPILDELSKYGTVTIKRIYGDWTLSLHAKWKSALLENSITPIQQFGYTQGKNATDSAMIIDAMDILYANSVEGFCIVSSDSDFTRLAARIRESGLTVIGMGEKKTPVPFRTACDVFTTLELLIGSTRRRGSGGRGSTADVSEVPEPIASKAEIEQAVVDIITDNTNNGKATGLGEIGSRLQKRYPDFDVRSYGTNLLSKLLSDFSSVKIAKDGSNVAVELADGFSGVVVKVDELETSEANVEAAATESEGDMEGEVRHGRRRRRGRRGGRSTHIGVEGSSEETVENEAPEPEPEHGSEREPESEVGEKPEAEKKPARKRATRRTRAKKEEVAGVPEEEAPAKSAPVKSGVEEAPVKSTTSGEASGVDFSEESDFIKGLVLEAGEEGVAVGVLSKRVRGRFKDFRVTKTGFRNLRLFVASLPGIRIDKREDDNYAVAE